MHGGKNIEEEPQKQTTDRSNRQRQDTKTNVPNATTPLEEGEKVPGRQAIKWCGGIVPLLFFAPTQN
jgi:hypothetical protein